MFTSDLYKARAQIILPNCNKVDYALIGDDDDDDCS